MNRAHWAGVFAAMIALWLGVGGPECGVAWPLLNRAAQAEEAQPPESIVVGNLADLTGLTSSAGKPYAEGVMAYTTWLNAHGGINGKQIKLLQVDYAYRIPEALQAYRRLRDSDGAVAIQGWGTGDTEALIKQVAEDRMPYFSGSYSAHLTDPEQAPYNFVTAADYSTQLRAGLQYLRDHWKENRKPRIAFIYPYHPYGKAPIPAGKRYAEEIGFEIVGEANVDLHAVEALTQLLELKEAEPDFAWLGGTAPSCAVVIKDARRLGMKTQFLINIWGHDASLVSLAGKDADGVFGLQATVPYGADVPGMKAIEEATGGQPRVNHFVNGWVSMMVLCEGLKRADDAGELNGLGIKRALETLRDFDTQGLTAPITFTPTDHRPNMSAVIVEYVGGEPVQRETIVLERRDEWLGF